MSITIHPTRQEDQQTIVLLIRQAKINPRNLNWEHFLITEENNQIVDIRQVKVGSPAGYAQDRVRIRPAGISASGN